MTTKKSPELKPTGEKVFSAVDGFVRMVVSHTRCNSMKAHTVWMPASLYPNGKGGYAVLNPHGFLIGNNRETRIPKDWIVHADDIDLDGVKTDEDSVLVY